MESAMNILDNVSHLCLIIREDRNEDKYKSKSDRSYKTLATFSSPKQNAKKIHRVKVWLLLADTEIHWCFTEKEVDAKGLLTNFLFTNEPEE